MSCTFRRKGGPKSRSQRGLQNAGWVRGLEPPTPRSTIDSKTSPKSLRFPGFCGILLSSAAFASLCEQTPVFPRNSGSRGSESGSLPAGMFAPEGKTKAASLSQPATGPTTPPDAPFVLTASDAATSDPTHETANLGLLRAPGDAGVTRPAGVRGFRGVGTMHTGRASLRANLSRATAPGSERGGQAPVGRPVVKTGHACQSA